MGKLNTIKMNMERNRFLLPLSLWIKKTGLISYIHKIEWIVNDQIFSSTEFIHYYNDNKALFDEVLDNLSDDISKKTYEAVISVKCGNSPSELSRLIVFPQYFPKDIITSRCYRNTGCFIDGGGYSGDTVIEFVKHSNKNYKSIFTWEPDEKNLFSLKKNTKAIRDVIIIEKGMYSKETTLVFDSFGNDKSRINNAGESIIMVDSVDNVCSTSNICFIKMDIEGAELSALEGCRQVIKRDRPVLAICIYHSCEDLWHIPLWIKENTVNYDLFIRAHSDSGSEIVAYGIPKELKNG